MRRHALAIGLVLLSIGCGDHSSSGKSRTLPPGQVGERPSWSFDGRTIAFVTFEQPGSRVASVNADGTELRRISEAFPGIDDVAWSPRRRELLVVTTDGRLPGYEHGDIQVLRADGQMVNLIRTSANERDAAWSPDGNKIAFAGGDGAIYV